MCARARAGVALFCCSWAKVACLATTQLAVKAPVSDETTMQRSCDTKCVVCGMQESTKASASSAADAEQAAEAAQAEIVASSHRTPHALGRGIPHAAYHTLPLATL